MKRVIKPSKLVMIGELGDSLTQREISEMFYVSQSTVCRVMKAYQEAMKKREDITYLPDYGLEDSIKRYAVDIYNELGKRNAYKPVSHRTFFDGVKEFFGNLFN